MAELRDEISIAGKTIELGQRRDVEIPVSESYSGSAVVIPITVWRAPAPGPTLFVSAAVHGDELNGTGIVRELILAAPFELITGSLVLIPVVNMLGLDRHQRYLPDRRDLNRCFPGHPNGTPAARYAHAFFQSVVAQCDYGIDFHTAAVRRTNYPNIRADMENPAARRLARAFGCELIVSGKGPRGSLRRSACAAGCPTIILEAGEVWKIEPSVVGCGVRGVANVLIELGMIVGDWISPPYQAEIEETLWVRANVGGLLAFHIAPGDILKKGQAIATNSNLLGKEKTTLASPVDGIVLGMTTLPVVTPGDPVCHIAVPPKGIAAIRRAWKKPSDESMHDRLRGDLATSLTISNPTDSNHPTTKNT